MEIIDRCKEKLRICVYSFTNDKLSELVYIKHRMKVKVEIISDDLMSLGKGSDL